MNTILRPFFLDVIRADVLRDSAGFGPGHIGRTNGIEQRSLSVIDVAHDGDHRRPLFAVLLDFGFFDFLPGFLFVADFVGGRAEIARQFFGQFHVQRLVDGGEDFLFHQPLHRPGGFDAELFGKLLAP